LTDFVGAIVELYSFDAYGNAIGFDPSVALTEFLYSGEQFDSKIGQQYLRQRYYDPATGRFNRLDPFFGNLNDPQSLHKYLYTHADPVNGIDPSGLFEGLTGMLSSMGSRAGMASTINTSIRVVNFVYKTIDRIQKIQSLFDMSSKLVKLAYRITTVNNPSELPTAIVTEIANEMVSKYANILSALQATLGLIKEQIGDKWNDIVEAMKNRAGFMASEAANEFIKHLPGYLTKVGKGLRFVIYLPSGPTDNKAGRSSDTFIPIWEMTMNWQLRQLEDVFLDLV
jgi:RHS repeat-associated protein